MKENIEEKSNEETDKINYDDNGDYKNAPPKKSKEIHNKSIFKSPLAKFEKKFYIHCFIPILIIIILLFVKKIIFKKK